MSRPSVVALAAAAIVGCLPIVASPPSAHAADPQNPVVTKLFTIQATALKELSGIAVSDAADAYYAIQDAGNDQTLFVLGPDGRELGVLPIPYPDEDWEDVSLFRRPGQTGRLYIADTGDASLARSARKLGPRKEFAIIRIDEPSVNLPQTLRIATDAVSFPVTFADGGSHNVESILVDPATERVYLIDKMAKTAKKGSVAGVWEGPATLSTKGNRFERIGTLPITGISSASFSPRGRFVAVRDAGTAYLWPTGSAGLAAALTGEPTRITLPKQPQGESLAFSPDGTGLVVGSEGVENPVLAVSLPDELHDPLYPFSADPRPNRAPLYVAAFAGAVLLAGVLLFAIRRRRLPRS